MRAKYEVDKETGLLKLDRVLYSSVYYPANYGFIPQTLGEDMDPLDIMILSLVSIQPLCLVPARVIGGVGPLRMEGILIRLHRSYTRSRLSRTQDDISLLPGTRRKLITWRCHRAMHYFNFMWPMENCLVSCTNALVTHS